VVKEVVMGAALVVTLVTGADYVVRAVRMSKTPRDKQEVVSPEDDHPPVSQMSAQAGPDRKNRDRIRPALRRLKLRG
jgi:hypothetical protein